MGKIREIVAREILDSRGNPTVEVEVFSEGGFSAVAAVPSGASTGTFEALELRDGDQQRYHGLGVQKAITNVNQIIAPALLGQDFLQQEKLDHLMLELDGTENKSNLGANAILGVSLAIARLAALEQKIPLYLYLNGLLKQEAGFERVEPKLPAPMFNVLNGGKHADSGLSVQEFKIVPWGIRDFAEQLRAGSEIFHELKKVLTEQGCSTGVGDEGGFSPKLQSNEEALSTIAQAIERAGYQVGIQVAIGLDVAASSFWDEKNNQYLLEPENKHLTREQILELYEGWLKKYQIISIEDGLAEEDWDGWVKMQKRFGEVGVLGSLLGKKPTMLIGDDLLVTNVKRLEKAINLGACNSVLIKVNQIGSLSETLACIRLAKKHKFKCVISHRSGETTDDFIADLAVGVAAEYMKSGSLSRGERICKYNRLLKISTEI